MTAYILKLPVDVFLHIFHYFSLPDVLNARQTCKVLDRISRLRSVWHMLLHTDVQRRNIPLPGISQELVDVWNATQLEYYIRRAVLMRQNWTSLSPVPSKRRVIQPPTHLRIFDLEFLPGKNHRWLISFGLNSRDSREVILQCWDVQTPQPVCIAIERLPRFESWAMNTKSDGQAHLAIQYPSPRVDIITVDFASTNPASSFVTISIFTEMAHGVHAFAGSAILTRDIHDRLYLWDVTDSQIPALELQSLRNEFERPMEVILQEAFVIVIRPRTLEIYGVPQVASSGAVIRPAGVHEWQVWAIDSVSISNQASRATDEHPAINILIRHGTILPWPLNLLHHYVLLRNEIYEPSNPVDANNLPYHIAPLLLRTIPAPVRLFVAYNMTIGSRGTAIWIDSHTEEYFNRGDSGQRLAGSPYELKHGDDRRVGSLEVQIESAARATVFDLSEDDKWVRVATDEEEGRIAVGSADGVITILDYAL